MFNACAKPEVKKNRCYLNELIKETELSPTVALCAAPSLDNRGE